MYKIHIISSARRDLDSYDRRTLIQIKEKIVALADEPRPCGCLKLTTDDGYRIRSGDYRILYRIDDRQRTVLIYRVKHRKDVYR